MNNKLAQIFALISFGNEYLTSFRDDVLDLLSFHSTFQYVSEVSFYKKKTLQDTSKKTRVVAKDSRTLFSYLKSQGVRHLKLDLLNIQDYLPLHVPSVFTNGGDWVIQTRYEGQIPAGGVEKDVTFVEEPDPDVNDQIDGVYRSKYQRYAESIIKSIISTDARSATIKLVPRGNSS